MSGRVRATGSLANPPTRVVLGNIAYRDGRRIFAPTFNASVDAAGNYQMQNVKPGDYYLRAEVFITSFPTYYPGTSDVNTATKITVGAGQELVGIDFDVNESTRFRISGTLLNLPPATGAGVVPTVLGFTFISIDPRSVDPSVSALTAIGGLGANGEFATTLPAGDWDIFPVIQERVAGGTPPLTAPAINPPMFATGRARVLVKDRDIENVVITVGSADIKGRIVVSPEEFARLSLRIAMLPKDNYPSFLLQHLQPVRVGSSGEFAFPSVPPGRYMFQVLMSPDYFYVADIRVGKKSIFADGILTVGTEPIDPIDVVLSSNGGVLRVTPASPAGPRTTVSAAIVSSRRIVLVPDDRRENALLYKAVTVGDGTSEIRGVAPGRYKVFAFQELPSGGAEQDADFMKPYEDFGVAVNVAAGETVDVQVSWIPAGK